MKVISVDKIALVLFLGVTLAILIAFANGRRDGMFGSGDYPGFFSLATLAAQRSPDLYSESAQSRIQKQFFPEREGFQPTVYPAPVAVLLTPLTNFHPHVGKLILCVLMLGCFLAGFFVLERRKNGIERRTAYRTFLFLSLTSAPVLASVVAAQNTGFSFLLAALFISLIEEKDQRPSRLVLAGFVAALWCLKPQFGLLAFGFLFGARLWPALVASIPILLGLYGVGVSALGPAWPYTWAEAAKKFAVPNLAVNGHQMSSLLSVAAWGLRSSEGVPPSSLPMVSDSAFPIALVVSAALGWWGRRSMRLTEAALIFIALVPLLAPQTLFYDLGIALAAVFALRRFDERRGWRLLAWVVLGHMIFFHPIPGLLPVFCSFGSRARLRGYGYAFTRYEVTKNDEFDWYLTRLLSS